MSSLQPETSQILRRILAAIFLLGVIGTAAELLLIEHTKDAWQWVPLPLLGPGFVLLLIHSAFQTTSTIRIFQFTMLACVLSGIIGIGLHYQAKMEFKLELNPELKGMELIMEAIKGASLPPILAPGVMIQLGLLGLAYTYRHPALLKEKS